MVHKGNHPQMALIQLSETLHFTTRKTVDGRTGQCWNGIKLASHLLHHRCGQTTFVLPTPFFLTFQSLNPWKSTKTDWKSHGKYPLVNVYITMENHHFSLENSRKKSPYVQEQTFDITRGYIWKYIYIYIRKSP